MQQKVNSTLAITLITLLAFWTVLYYATHHAYSIADASVSGRNYYINEFNTNQESIKN